MANKRIYLYVPLFGPALVHPKTFKSIFEMAMEPIENCQIIPYIHTLGPELSLNRNDAIARILDLGADFIMFCDADMIFPRSAIKNLLESIEDAGACTGLYWRKAIPHRCVIGHYMQWDKHNLHYKASMQELGFIDSDGDQCLFYKALEEFEGIKQVDVFGMGCVLIRTDVFKVLKQPYFKYFDGYQTGDHSFGPISEEMTFCAVLHKAGINVLADSRVKCGHITEIVISEPQKAKICA